MAQVADKRSQEFDTVVDLIDALEVCLPPYQALVEERSRLAKWREVVDEISAMPLDTRLNGLEAIGRVHDLGADVYKASYDWPAGDIHQEDVRSRLKSKLELSEQVERNVADFSLARHIKMLESTLPMPFDYPSIVTQKSILLYNNFCADSDFQEPTLQEYLALLKLDLSQATEGQVARPSPYDAFDPSLVSCERHWQSATQLETSIFYNGQDLGRFGDDAVLHPFGHYQPKMTEADVVHAARNIFYKGDHNYNRDPLTISSTRQMHKTLLADIEHARTLTDLILPRVDHVEMIAAELEELMSTPEVEELPVQAPQRDNPSL